MSSFWRGATSISDGIFQYLSVFQRNAWGVAKNTKVQFLFIYLDVLRYLGQFQLQLQTNLEAAESLLYMSRQSFVLTDYNKVIL